LFRKIAVLVFGVILLTSIYGCIALLAGAVGGVGTAAWLSGKLSQEVSAPFDRTIKATKSALRSLDMQVTKETVEYSVAQIISKYADGRTVWIDIRRIREASSKIEVRVGAVGGDKEASDMILKRISRYLSRT
jgi:Protein of unknown function (DUF3568)